MFVLNFWAVSSVPGASVQFSLSVLAFWRIGVLVCSCSVFWQSLRSPVPLFNFRLVCSRFGVLVCWCVFVFSFLAVSSVPGAFVQFSQRSAAGALVRGAGPLLEPRVPPLVQLRAAPGPWCGASVGTTCSAPCTTSPPPIISVRILFF